MVDVLQAIWQRRSIRKYKKRQVDTEKLNTLLEAAMAGPSACNSQPWEFIVVSGCEEMEALKSNLLHGQYTAPAAIVVCSNPAVARKPSCHDFWVQDCSAAVENILLAAVGLGLGTVWLGIYPEQRPVDALRKLLSIPDGVTPLAVIYVGYPAEEKEERTQYRPDRVFWQQYGHRDQMRE